MPPTQPPLSTLLPPLILGTATFNTQFNTSPHTLPIESILQRTLTSGITAFDTSPYYGPSESLLGSALSSPLISSSFPRSSYLLLTKVGRISATEFDFSPSWVRYSAKRSLERLRTQWLDVVYAHDVEFVSPREVLEAVRELRRLRDEEGVVKYVGISGYPLDILVEMAEMVLEETGEPLDVVMNYARGGVQNCELWDEEQGWIERLKNAGVACVPNASLLGMGLLRGNGVPVGEMGDWHPAPRGLREAVGKAARWCDEQGEKLEDVALRWALDQWVRRGEVVGGKGGLGISVLGVSTMEELEDNLRVWKGVCDGIGDRDVIVDEEERVRSFHRRDLVERLVEEVRKILREWKDYSWPSPGEGFVNTREFVGAGEETKSTVVEMEEVKGDIDLQVTVAVVV